MSMLAEPRSRQKWSHDPRNTNWARDKTKFGYQMLTKMGWSEGSGLGANLSGNVDHITVNKRGSNAGVGLKKSHDDDWIAHQDDFNALLSSLNGNPSKSTYETSSLENKMKSSKIRYTKFVKSKDLSNASSDDLACIFGQRSKCATVTQEYEDERKSDTSEEHQLNKVNHICEEVKTVDSQLCMNEYFAKKMEALRRKKTVEDNPINSSVNNINTNDTDEIDQGCVTEKKKKKKKKTKDDESPVPSPCSQVEEDNLVRKRKKEKEDLVLENGLVKKKKKKRKEVAGIDDELVVHNCVGQVDQVVRKKKKKKRVLIMVTEELIY